MANGISNGFRTIKKRYLIWLGVALILCLLLSLLKGNREVMNVIVSAVRPARQAAGAICAFVSFSVAEAMIAAAIVLLLLWIVISIRSVVRAKQKTAAAMRRVTGLLCVGLTVCFFLFLLLGANYYADSFQDKSGLRGEPSSLEQLYQTTLYFAGQTAAFSDQVSRDENGVFSQEMDVLFQQSKTIYPALEQEYPFLKGKALMPKPVFFSSLMSRFSFTGFYFPFTGEANVNVAAPLSMMPVTIAHELAHQRGVAAEDEANFVAILASIRSGLPAYAYSGYLLGYIHLGNALYQKSPELQAEVFSLLTPETVADLRQNNAYWARYEGSASEVASEVYDRFLKGYGQDLGVESYGAVVDLLIAWNDTRGNPN